MSMFVSTGDAARILKAETVHINYLCRVSMLPHVRAGKYKRPMLLVVEAYVRSYADFLNGMDNQTLNDMSGSSARVFASTDIAQQLSSAAQIRFASDLKSNPELTIPEAAVLLGVTTRTIHNWIDGGILKVSTDEIEWRTFTLSSEAIAGACRFIPLSGSSGK